MDITGVILAGGKSSRFGTDKGLALFNKQPLVSYSIELLSAITNNIIISSNNPEYKQFSYPLVADLFEDIGPLGGIYSVLKKSESEHYIFVPCDMPFLTTDILNTLIKYTYGHNAVIASCDERFAIPTVAYYNKSILTTLEYFIHQKKYKLQDLIKSLKSKVVMFESNEVFKNINSRKDL